MPPQSGVGSTLLRSSGCFFFFWSANSSKKVFLFKQRATSRGLNTLYSGDGDDEVVI